MIRGFHLLDLSGGLGTYFLVPISKYTAGSKNLCIGLFLDYFGGFGDLLRNGREHGTHQII